MTIYYDISDILEYVRHHTTVSGIQRVSLNVLCRLAGKHDGDTIRVSAFHPRHRQWLSYDPTFFSGEYVFDRDRFVRHFDLDPPRMSWLGRWLGRALGAGARRDGAVPDSGIPMQPTVGDVIFVPGATWGLDAHRKLLLDARLTTGAAVYQFIHDLIPLTAREHVIAGTPEKFESWLDELSRSVDGFIANSHATKRDLDSWLDRRGRTVETRVVPLAHQFGLSPRPMVGRGAGSASPDASIGAHVRAAAETPYVLCVGTREPRKNLLALVNVWRSIQARLGAKTPRLVIAGSRGWMNEAFDKFIASTGSLGGIVTLVERPSDPELEYLYARCLFSAFVSYKEGWGLPIGEGLWFGRPVICSNASAMPEVGGSLADYVDPNSLRSIEDAATRLIVDPDYREGRAAEIAAGRLRSWQDVADDLWPILSRGPHV